MFELYLTIMWIAGALFSFGVTSVYYIIKLHRLQQQYAREKKLSTGLQKLYYEKMGM